MVWSCGRWCSGVRSLTLSDSRVIKTMIPVPDHLRQPPAYFHMRILVGPGALLTPRFAAARGITHVINCAYDEDSPTWFRTAYPKQYICMNAHDTPYHNILDWYPLFEAYLNTFLRQGNGVVYVHCQAGMNRSGFLALAYICKNFHMEIQSSIHALQRQRPCLFQNPIYMNQVKTFINGCVQSEKNTRHDDKRIDNGNA